MNRLQVSSTWQVGEDGTKRSLIETEYPGPDWSDITGSPDLAIPPDPNVVIMQGDKAEDATLAAIDGDVRFVVLWSEAVIYG